MGRAFYRGAEACILVYDITNEKSFENLNVWRNDFTVKAMVNENIEIPFYIIGNKIDMEADRKITPEIIREFLDLNPGVLHFETSALDGRNVN